MNWMILVKNWKLFSNRQSFRLLSIIILVVLLIPVRGFCFSVTAQVDRNRISINDSVVLSIVFEDGEGDVDTSALTDFTVVSRSSSSNISIINGKYSKTVTALYTLIPKRKGTLTIPPLKVEYENRNYTTNEISIEVSDQAVSRNDSRDIFVEAGISGTSLFTGQQAVYQLRFYSAVKFSNAALQPPSFKGFTAKEAGDRKNYRENINGRPYNVAEVNYVIIPEISGELQIDPAIVSCDVAMARNSRDPFDDPFFSNGFFSFGRSETRRFSTNPVMVKVESLPPYSADVPFSGLVGNFSIKAELDNLSKTEQENLNKTKQDNLNKTEQDNLNKTEQENLNKTEQDNLNKTEQDNLNKAEREDLKLKIGDSATLTITISGKGNLMDAQAPTVAIPSDFKVYDDSPEEKIELTLQGYSGEKIFKRAIVPIKSGKYTIEPIILTFFNVSTHAYETISTTSIKIEVEQSTEQSGNQQSFNADANDDSLNNPQNLNRNEDVGTNSKKVREKKNVEFTGKDILSIKEDASVLLRRCLWEHYCLWKLY
ncbi:MAG: protein BatD [Desulfamplus sp.]|nr:protein BatD [Desulfamplus sp.]